MNLYLSTVDALLAIPVVDVWPELRTLITQASDKEPKHWQLPVR